MPVAALPGVRPGLASGARGGAAYRRSCCHGPPPSPKRHNMTAVSMPARQTAGAGAMMQGGRWVPPKRRRGRSPQLVLGAALSEKEVARLRLSSDERDALRPNSRPVGEPWDQRADPSGAARALRDDGFVHLGGVLGPNLCEQLLQEVDHRIEQVDRQRNETAFLGGAPSRYDLKLPLSGVTRKAVLGAVSRGGLGAVIAECATDGAFLAELGVLASCPGANRQPMHPDTVCHGAPDEFPILTTFVALQDVTDDMGPTELLPGTNTLGGHQALCGAEHPEHWDLLRSSPSVRATLRKGDAVTFDSRTIHCGGENRSEQRRVLLYISFQRAPAGRDELPPAPERRTPPSAYSILADHFCQYKLGGLRADAALIEEFNQRSN